MTATDALFTGSIPALYQRCLVPMLFAPYARDLAARAAALAPGRILETAAGTGVVTEALLEAAPDAEIVATDLNQAMLDAAAAAIRAPNLRFQAADAQALPFPDSGFDLVVCQFGVMFFPDRVAAYREARRVLRPGGHFLFSAWSRIEDNPLSEAVTEAVADLFPDDPAAFLRRVPFGYHDIARIEEDLHEAGFDEIEVETVEERSRSGSALEAATGFCHGTPLRAEIEARGSLDAATGRAAAALARFEGAAGVDAPMSALVVSAAA